jgi:SAM-dependent methyltransferase
MLAPAGIVPAAVSFSPVGSLATLYLPGGQLATYGARCRNVTNALTFKQRFGPDVGYNLRVGPLARPPTQGMTQRMRHHLYRMHEAVLRSAPIRPGDRILYLGCNSAAIPFPDEYFDLVIAFGAYERFPTLDRVFDELSRVLKPAGKVYWHDVSTGLEGVRDRIVHALFMGRRPSRSQQALTAVRTKMSAYFTIEFHRRWTHTWGKQSCLLVGKKTTPVP